MSFWIGLTAVALTIVLIAEKRDRRRWVWVAKPLASVGFVGAAYAAGALETGYGQVVLVALVLCLAGDVLLIPKSKPAFLSGIISFLLGHVAFGVGFVLLGLRWGNVLWALIPLLVLSGFIGRYFVQKAPKELKVAVAGYVVVITGMVALSVGTLPGWVIPTAAVAFFASDLSVAMERFVRPHYLNRLWGLPLYYAAQHLFAWSAALRA